MYIYLCVCFRKTKVGSTIFNLHHVNPEVFCHSLSPCFLRGRRRRHPPRLASGRGGLCLLGSHLHGQTRGLQWGKPLRETIVPSHNLTYEGFLKAIKHKQLQLCTGRWRDQMFGLVANNAEKLHIGSWCLGWSSNYIAAGGTRLFHQPIMAFALTNQLGFKLTQNNAPEHSHLFSKRLETLSKWCWFLEIFAQSHWGAKTSWCLLNSAGFHCATTVPRSGKRIASKC